MPEVSVIIPAYNYAAYTVEAVESVLAQTYKDYELIVVDDGSTDGTGEALRRFGDRIRYFYKTNGGACSARNFGIQRAQGRYIALLDCDDLFLPAKLETSLKAFTDKRTGLVYTGVYLIDAAGKVTGENRTPGHSGRVLEQLVLSNFINNPSVVIDRECFDRVGLFDEKMFFAADWDMWLRIAEKYEIKY
ncbi:MAG: glycosyltransferase, partial [Candidatus Margulisbacteria bacterium]|nr:glycosyltransferase [Candidatus Margulisiibacteriota bacterium]